MPNASSSPPPSSWWGSSWPSSGPAANASCAPPAPGGCANGSGPPSPPPAGALPGAPLAVAVAVVYALLGAVALAGNSAVLLVLLRAPRRSVTHLFLLNLAAADQLCALVLPVNIADLLLRRWPLGELACKLVVAADQYNTLCGLYFPAVLGADRYRVVLAAARSRRAAGRTRGAARAVALAVWALATLVVLPFAVFARLDDEQGRRQCVLVFPRPEAAWWRASRLYSLLLGFVLPASALCGLYCALLCRLRAARPAGGPARALGRARRRATRLVLAIVAACLLCWTPYHLGTVVALTADLPHTPAVVAASYVITGLSYAHSCLNPFLYAFLDDGFRQGLRRLLACRPAA
ncbi:neuropeptides B/W receptor type 1 [Sorex fumeus]|uniref:neuropeptides B/W receptor type 1 n=1 Tax=Sorex fumeus TaxID=62283 RepID=UPI0024ACC04A|nr:neuropeptides B/W receptor type 1 [Sorex fumeus]